MLASVIIINYNTFDLTVQCIRSVLQHTHGHACEIVVVDNASPDDDPERFRQLFPDIVLVKSPENGGFAKGNNLGIAHASGDIILLLNSDTWLTEDSISKAADKLISLPQAGVLSVSLCYPDGRPQHYARRFPSLKRELLDLARPLLMLLPYRRRARLMLNQYYNGDFDVWADWVGAAFFMFRRSLLEALPGGRLDERFFMYGEDQLWCWQVSRLGLGIFNYSGTRVVHIENASAASRAPRYNRLAVERELLLYRLRHGSGPGYLLFKAVYVGKRRLGFQIRRLMR